MTQTKTHPSTSNPQDHQQSSNPSLYLRYPYGPPSGYHAVPYAQPMYHSPQQCTPIAHPVPNACTSTSTPISQHLCHTILRTTRIILTKCGYYHQYLSWSKTCGTHSRAKMRRTDHDQDQENINPTSPLSTPQRAPPVSQLLPTSAHFTPTPSGSGVAGNGPVQGDTQTDVFYHPATTKF